MSQRPLKIEHLRHGTTLEVRADENCAPEGVCLTLESYVNGKREQGIAFFLDQHAERALFDWLLERHPVEVKLAGPEASLADAMDALLEQYKRAFHENYRLKPPSSPSPQTY